MKHARVAVMLMVVVLYVALPRAIYSCGPYFPTAIFSFQEVPDFPVPQFLDGKLGVVQGGLKTPYLLVAYRYLSHQPLTQAEQRAIMGYLEQLPDYEQMGRPELGVSRWMEARTLVTKQEVKISRYANNQNLFLAFENCQEDAFDNAAKTLRQRVKQFGAQSQVMKGWVEAQDVVFADCEKYKGEPEPAKETDPSLIRADRAYQIAAAHLYVQNLDAAEAEFHKISLDKESPWSGLSTYLEARVIVRRASFAFDQPDDPKTDREELERAEGILRAIVARSDLKQWHHAARERIGLIEARIHPDERVAVLAEQLSKPRESDLLHQEVNDFFWLERRKHVAQQNEMMDWMMTMRGVKDGDDAAGKHALAKWRETKSQAWLVAAFNSQQQDGAIELVNAAMQIERRSPAFMTAVHFLTTTRGYDRKFTNELLKLPSAELPASARNRILHEKLVHATSLEEFLSAAARVPVGVDWEMGESETEMSDKAKDTPLFDEDAAVAFNRQMPLSVLAKAAGAAILPQLLRKELVKAAWTKGFILRDEAAVKQVSPMMAEYFPEMRTYIETYLKEKDPALRQFALVDGMLHAPGITPLVQEGVLRDTAFTKIDNFSNNWWCGKEPLTSATNYPVVGMLDTGWKYYSSERTISPADVEFLSAAEKNQAAKEWAALADSRPGKTVLSQKVLEFQKSHPDDTRVPTALDLSLRALRYGCSQGEEGLAHKVFKVLHAKYPKSAAAKRNRPWGDW